jgi:hypothetical protein
MPTSHDVPVFLYEEPIRSPESPQDKTANPNGQAGNCAMQNEGKASADTEEEWNNSSGSTFS